MSDRPRADWSARLQSDTAWTVQAVAAGVLAAALLGYLAWLRPPQSHLWGDEGTYLAMTASLARDFDLAFTESDREWALARDPEKGVAVILQQTSGGITYSKPPLYPLLAAVPYLVLGEAGLVMLNVLSLALGLFFAWIVLRRIGHGGQLGLTLVAFAGYAAVTPYLLWRMTESLQVGLALAGLALACGALREPKTDSKSRWDSLLTHRAAPWVGGALLGLLTALRASNALLIVGAIAACALTGHWRRARTVAIGAVATVGLALLASLVTLGTASPYTAERSSFNAAIGYPAGPENGQSLQRFEDKPADHRVHVRFSKINLFAAYYFLVGRHTGLLAYFPLSFVMIFMLLRRPDRLGLAMLGSCLGLAVFYLIYTPQNYFGGSTFIGNRYFIVAYPALLLGLGRLPSWRSLIGVVAIGLLVGSSAIRSVRLTRDIDPTSQSHASAGVFNRLPYESTAIEIQGHKSRFWSRDYVRFTTPFADVQRNRFVLHSDRPHAELMIASRLPRDEMTFLVWPPEGLKAIDWRDWARSGWGRIERNARTRRGVISFRPATPWRAHSYWWKPEETYDVRVLRMGIFAGFDVAREAHVYYLGSNADILKSGKVRVVSRRVPKQGVAGESATARLRVVNASPTVWDPEGVLPVMIGYRVLTDDEQVAGGKRAIPELVRPGDEIDLEIDIDWPEAPGTYRLVVDLSLHPIYWFSEISRRPLARHQVEVLPAT